MGEKLFVYGTLKDPEIQTQVLGRTVERRPDILSGFVVREATIGKRKYPVAMPDKKSAIQGSVLDLNPTDLKKTDRYETDYYERIEVVLYSGERAWVYQAGPRNVVGASHRLT